MNMVPSWIITKNVKKKIFFTILFLFLISPQASLAAKSLCGETSSGLLSDFEQPTGWTQYKCVEPNGRTDCYARKDYAKKSGTGCPGKTEQCCPPLAAAASETGALCGKPGTRESFEVPSGWAGYKCMEPNGRIGCLAKNIYTDKDGAGCPGGDSTRCCPPAGATSGDIAPTSLKGNYGIDAVASEANLNITTNIQTLIGDIIGAVLSFVGVIFFALMLYGGIMWMTAAGNPENQKKAITTIFSAVIGVIIVFSAYAITNFVFEDLVSGGSSSSGSGPSKPISTGVPSTVAGDKTLICLDAAKKVCTPIETKEDCVGGKTFINDAGGKKSCSESIVVEPEEIEVSTEPEVEEILPVRCVAGSSSLNAYCFSLRNKEATCKIDYFCTWKDQDDTCNPTPGKDINSICADLEQNVSEEKCERIEDNDGTPLCKWE